MGILSFPKDNPGSNRLAFLGSNHGCCSYNFPEIMLMSGIRLSIHFRLRWALNVNEPTEAHGDAQIEIWPGPPDA
jgi:hypothetical protein